MAKIEFLDTTLRDGAQAEGIAFSPKDKFAIFELLDSYGIDIIEGGDPAANPKDFEFFESVKSPKLAAFGSTRRRDNYAPYDQGIIRLLEAGTNVVCLFGKSSIAQVEDVLKASPEQNLDMIAESVAYLKSRGKRVIFDAEHFFDGYKSNAAYAIKTLIAAYTAGADTLTLCDTNGGCFPKEIFEITEKTVKTLEGARIGIHAHNDAGMAVASSIMAVRAGAVHVQGTFLGFGERCGNANLSTIIANLALKEDFDIGVDLKSTTAVARAIAEISNINLPSFMPYVGASAFAHKAGTHSDAMLKNPISFEHVDPEAVGNKRRFLLSEMAGRAAVVKKLENLFPALDKDDPKTQEIVDAVKILEQKGYQFEGADGSFVLLAERVIGNFKPSFELDNYKIDTTYPDGDNRAEICISVGGEKLAATENGNGPVNALDKALRSALSKRFPEIEEVSLADYKVRVIDSGSATGAMVRVLITSSDKQNTWTTVGVSTDIIEASWSALSDSFEYKLTGQGKFI